MEQAAESEKPLSFMDQCTVICLGYVSSYGDFEIRSDKASVAENIDALRRIAEQELTEFGDKEDLEGYIDAAGRLAKLTETKELVEEKLQEILIKLKNSLDQDTFNECADSFIDPPIESWEKVSMVLHLIYKSCEQHDTAMVGTVIDIGVRYMRKTVTDFVSSQGGWRNIESLQPQEQQGDISGSIVVIPQEAVQEVTSQKDTDAGGDAPCTVQDIESPAKEGNDSMENPAFTSPKNQTPIPLSPLDTPPFSIPSSVNTDDERDSLATPPEMVEKPLMTDSYIQAMGEDDLRRVSSPSGNGFEFIGSDNGAGSDAQSATRSIDDAQAFEPTDEKVKLEEVEEKQDTPQQSEESTPEASGSPNEPIFGGYLPHISIGVAAAAAVAGFFVLKKNM